MMSDSATGKVRDDQTVDTARFIIRLGYNGTIGVVVGIDFQVIGEQRMSTKVFWLLQPSYHFFFGCPLRIRENSCFSNCISIQMAFNIGHLVILTPAGSHRLGCKAICEFIT